MDEPTAQLISQLGTIGIQMFFTWMQQSGKTEDEIKEIFQAEKEKFQSRNPNTLPLPPTE